jgi:hypothetical protein
LSKAEPRLNGLLGLRHQAAVTVARYSLPRAVRAALIP